MLKKVLGKKKNQVVPINEEALHQSKNDEIMMQGLNLHHHRPSLLNLFGASSALPPPPSHQFAEDVTKCAISIDLSVLAYCYDKPSLKILRDKTELSIEGHSEIIRCICISSDGTYVVSGSSDKTCLVWDAMLGKELNRHTHDTAIAAVAISPDCKHVASSGTNGKIEVWTSVEKHLIGDALIVLTGHAMAVHSLVFHHDGCHLSSGSADKTIRVWELKSAACVKVLEGHKRSIDCIALSPNGTCIASGGQDQIVRIWEWAMKSPTFKELKHKERIRRCVFSHDGKLIATICWKELRIYDAVSCELHTQFELTSTIHDIAFNNTNTILHAVTEHALIEFPIAPTILLDFIGEVRRLAISPNGLYVAIHDKAGNTGIWNTGINQLYHKFTDCDITDIKFNAQSTILGFSDYSNTVHILGLETKSIESLPFPQEDAILFLEFSNEGGQLATGGFDQKIVLRSLTERGIVTKIMLECAVFNAGFSSDDKLLATASQDNLTIWNISDLTSIREVRKILGTFTQCKFSMNDTWLFAGTSDGIVKFWAFDDIISSKSSISSESIHHFGNDKIRSLISISDGHSLISLTRTSLFVWNLDDFTHVCFDLHQEWDCDGCDGSIVIETDMHVRLLPLSLLQTARFALQSIIQQPIAPDLISCFRHSVLSPNSNFFWNGHSCDLFLALLYQGRDAAFLQCISDAFPDCPIQLLRENPDCSALHLAASHKRHSELEVLIQHAARYVLKDAHKFYLQAVTVREAFPLIAACSAGLAIKVLELLTKEIGDVHASSDVMIASHDDIYGKDLLGGTKKRVLCKHAVLLLPESVNMSSVRDSNVDILDELVVNDNVDAFKVPAVNAMLSHRWKRMHKWFYLQWFLYSLFLASATVFTQFVASDNLDEPLASLYSGSSNRTSLIFSILTLALNVWFLFCEAVEMYKYRLFYLLNPWNYLDLSSHVFVVVISILHCLRSHNELPLTSVTIVILWFKFLGYLRGFRESGVFVRLTLMILYEIRYFLLVWGIVLFGFANAYTVLFRASDPGYINLAVSFLTIFSGIIGGFIPVIRNTGTDSNMDFVNQTALYNLQLVIYVLFVLIANVLFLNLLIALMGSVYSDVTEKAYPQYRFEKARFLISLERLFLLRDNQRASKKWLHFIGPHEAKIWAHEDIDVNVSIENLKADMQKATKEESEKLRAELIEIKKQLLQFQQTMKSLSCDHSGGNIQSIT